MILEYLIGTVISLFVFFSLLTITQIHTVINRIMRLPSKVAMSKSPEPMNRLLYTQKKTADVIRLRILRQGHYLRLSRWAQCNPRVLLRGRQEDQCERKERKQRLE